MVNSQNKHWLALSRQDVLTVMKTKHSILIMVFEVLINDGDVIFPFIFPHGCRLNMEAYIKSMEEVVLSWIERVAAGRLYIWQRDCTIPYKQENPVLAVSTFLQLPNPQLWLPNSLGCYCYYIYYAKFHFQRQNKNNHIGFYYKNSHCIGIKHLTRFIMKDERLLKDLVHLSDEPHSKIIYNVITMLIRSHLKTSSIRFWTQEWGHLGHVKILYNTLWSVA